MPVNQAELIGHLFTVAEAAKILDVTPDNLRRLIRDKVILAHHPPRRRGYIVPGESLIAYLTTDAPPPRERYTGKKAP